jgi:ubiquinone/menaquinone biosynthesis C-methylase UbiE
VNLRKLYGAIYQPFFRKFRSERLRRLCEVCGISENSRILDVGGSYNTFWVYSPVKPKVTILNPKASWLECDEPGFSTMLGDGRALPFENKSFDVVVSNSVIEHLGEWQQQQIFAEEIRRVGRSYWVQTPNRGFFMEPHFLAPLIHFLPKRYRKRVARYFTVWGLTIRPTPKQVDDLVEEISLLNKPEVQELFPDAEIICEKWCGMTKSIIACRLQA